MILYLDASALVKRYIAEQGTEDINGWIEESLHAGTVSISRVEISAAISKAVRMQVLDRGEGLHARNQFHAEWDRLVRLQVTEAITVRGDALAWEYGLRGYDAVHLAAAISWQETIGEQIVLVTYDRQLWEAGKPAGLKCLPQEI